MLISAAMIVKNEEANLPRCLESIQPLVDEIAVVDTGSTDRTADIANHYGCKVGFHQWNDDFAAARNASLDLASGDWILIMDADEWLEHADLKALSSRSVNGYIFNVSSLRGPGKPHEVSKVLRFVRRLPGMAFHGRIHEQLNTPPPIEEADVTIHHSGYLPEVMEGLDKYERNHRLLELEIREHPDAHYPHWQMARSLIHSGRPDEAIPYARKALELAPDTKIPRERAYTALVLALTSTGKDREALSVCEQAIRAGCQAIYIAYMKGSILTKAGRTAEAQQWLMAMQRQYGFTSPQQMQDAIRTELVWNA